MLTGLTKGGAGCEQPLITKSNLLIPVLEPTVVIFFIVKENQL